jgi:hypothetical protein
MNRRISNGAYCVFRYPWKVPRNGRILLVQHRDIADPEHGGTYTVKTYERTEGIPTEAGERRASISLKPDSDDPRFVPLVLTPEDDG